MTFAAVNRSEIAFRLKEKALLVCASPRLAAEWKRCLVAASTANVVATPPVESWQAWLAKLAREQTAIPVPLNQLQELQLWEQVIHADTKIAGSRASARGLARHAAEAYKLLCEYRIGAETLSGAGEEAEALQRWIRSMHNALAQKERILAADLPELLLPLIGSAAEHGEILLDGFDRFTPIQQSLLQALQKNGVSLVSVARGSSSPSLTLTACVDAISEYRHAARKIAAILQADPHTRIGVVTSRQVKDTETLRRILDETLLSSTQLSSAIRTAMQATAMAGAPLATAPLIRQLLNMLQLAGRNGAPHKELSPLLFSPGIRGYAEERTARAVLDAKLRENNRHYLNFRSLLAMDEMTELPQFAGVLQSLLDWEPNARSAGEWVKSVHSLLQSAGFLQVEAAGRSSGEIRQLNLFRESLSSLIAVDAVREQMAWSSFLSLLVSACNETPLSLTAHYPQISVLPLEQSTGHRFDVLFALGLDDEALPMPARPTPLLPLALQQRHNLPASTAALAFAESGFLWQQLLQEAPSIHVSFAEMREERELRPSPFLAGIKTTECNETVPAAEMPKRERFDDAPAVPLSAEEQVQGGSAIVRNQSLCPFRAFATHRLNLAPLGETVPGVTPAEKGSLLHQALQFIWEELRSQSALLALDEKAVEILIGKAVEHAWQHAHVTASKATQQFERRRMQRVLAEWLDIERERPPFSVERCEKAYRLELPESGTLRFPVRLKADRIDHDAEGRKILIDYKTGQKQSAGKWIGDRMPEPQLPLYTMAEELGENDAVCFARVRSGDMGYEGLSGEATGIQGVSIYKGNDEEAEEWTDLLACWKKRINALAAEFIDGRCEVMPQDARACDYCGLEAVCRIDEIGIDRDEENEA